MVKPEPIYRLQKEQNRNSLHVEGKYRENDGSRNRDSRRPGPTGEAHLGKEAAVLPLGRQGTDCEPAAQGAVDPRSGSLPTS